MTDNDPTPMTIEDIEALLLASAPPEQDPFPGDPAATWDYWSGLDNPTAGPPETLIWARLRHRRNEALKASDANVTPDASGDVDAWMTYRQALRDLPASTPDPTQVAWPEPPLSTTPNPNRVAVKAQALAALDTNRTFLALAAPTNAQTLAQVKALARQNNGIIRLLLGKLDATD